MLIHRIKDQLLPFEDNHANKHHYVENISADKSASYNQSDVIANRLIEQQSQPLKSAAVLVPLIEHRRENPERKTNNMALCFDVLLTRRAAHLKHHPSQISFPGGRLESIDSDLRDTALRETFEEIGIPAEKIRLLGRLPSQHTTSQFSITPFVGVIDKDYSIIPDENEVEEVFTVPLDFITQESNQELHEDFFNGRKISYYVIRYKHYNIWGATARILVNFARRITRANDT
ncbi:NUDIX hydrolase [Aliikangiella maris]|uniref:CoA pyrophosphatase n=2 Tax=Aliikangiella maris TaxID=3162458 RepID=A0ABV3MJ18_9GAMM